VAAAAADHLLAEIGTAVGFDDARAFLTQRGHCLTREQGICAGAIDNERVTSGRRREHVGAGRLVSRTSAPRPPSSVALPDRRDEVDPDPPCTVTLPDPAKITSSPGRRRSC